MSATYQHEITLILPFEHPIYLYIAKTKLTKHQLDVFR